jgi:ribonuclease HII
MTVGNRELWHGKAKELEKKEQIKIALSHRTARVIDKKGITACIQECIAENLQKLSLDPKHCIVLLDGSLKAPAEYKHQTTIIKGDSTEKIISLASVIAKVERDSLMTFQYKKYPLYRWNTNKGYGTQAHVNAIKKWGITPLHRASFLKNII